MSETVPVAKPATRWQALLQRALRGSVPMMLASLAAQLLAFLISPILTRLYSPGDMGVFALYSSCLSIMVLLSTGRYDMAIIAPARDTVARSLVFLVSLIASAALGLALVVLALGALAYWAGLREQAPPLWAWLVPFGVFLTAAQASTNAYLTRKLRFINLAAVRLSAALLSSGLSVLFGWWHFGSLGLMLAALTGLMCAAAMARRATGLPLWPRVASHRVRAVAKQFVNYPRIDLPSSLMGVLASQMPTLLLGACFGAPVLGLYALVDRMLAAPLVTLGAPLGASFRVEATRRVNGGQGFRAPYVRTLLMLIGLSTAIYVPVFFFGEQIFALVFGAKWAAAGRMAEVLAVLYFVRLITSPLSMSLYVRNRMQVDLLGQIALCLLYLAAIGIGWRAGDVHLALVLIASFNSCIYVGYIIYGYVIAKA